MDVPRVKLVKAPAAAGGTQGCGTPLTLTRLSSIDQLCVPIAFGSITFWPGGRFDEAALERALELTLGDLPLLSGRLTPPSGLSGSLSELHIEHGNQGAMLVVQDRPDLQLDHVGPDSWPMQGLTAASPELPFYAERMYTGQPMMGGLEPLVKVRLTRLADGDVLAVTLAHTITDGMRYPALVAHLATRYRQTVAAQGGQPPAAGELPTTLLECRPEERGVLALDSLRKAVPRRAGGVAWQPQAPVISAGPLDYFKYFYRQLVMSLRRVDLVILHVPQARLDALLAGARATQAAAAGPGGAAALAPGGGARITPGDVAQALGGMLVHAATGQPLIPSGRMHMDVLVQLAAAKDMLMGNAMHFLPISAPEGQAMPGAEAPVEALHELAALIRRATAEFRAQPEQAAEGVARYEAMCQAPLLQFGAWFYGQHMATLASRTNYVPVDEAVDFGWGPPACQQLLITPPGDEYMTLIRPAQPPYPQGLFYFTALTPSQQRSARKFAAAVAPDACWLGNVCK